MTDRELVEAIIIEAKRVVKTTGKSIPFVPIAQVSPAERGSYNYSLCEKIIEEAKKVNAAAGGRRIPIMSANPEPVHEWKENWRKNHPELISLTDAAEMLGISKLALARYFRHDMIDTVVHNGAHYVSVKDVHNLQPL